MPSDSAFKKQAEIAREALTTFNTIRTLNAPGPIKTALEELVTATVRFFFNFSTVWKIINWFSLSQIAFNNFVPFFVTHPLFQEIPPAVHLAIEDFIAKHPGFDMPASTPRIAGLDARVKDSLVSPAKKGLSLSLSFSLVLILFSFY